MSSASRGKAFLRPARLRRREGMAFVGIAAAMSFQHPASAEASAEQRAAARVLFDNARQLVRDGHAAEACPMFEESQRLDPGTGTQFNLADCWEVTGRTASAWATFLEVASLERREGHAEREKLARLRAQAIEPRVPRLRVVVRPTPGVSWLEVRRDGLLLGPVQLSTPLPVDPGKHTLAAEASKYERWSSTITVPDHAGVVEVVIPPLHPVSTANPPELPKSPIRWVGVGIGASGVVLLGLSGYFGWTARSSLRETQDYCDGLRCWDPKGVDLHNEARREANTATILGVGGAVLLASGGALYWFGSRTKPPTQPRDSEHGPTYRIGLSAPGIVARGQF